MDDATLILISTVIADVLVAGAWLGVAVAIWIVTSIRTRSLLAELPEGKAEEPEGPIRWVLYLVAALFWPAALALGIYFLTKPETARAGRACIAILLAYVTFSVVVAVASVTVVAAMFPWVLIP